MKIFESHAHLDSGDFDKDRENVIKKCFSNNIEFIINIGVDEKSSLKGIKLAELYSNIYATVGYHPHDAEAFNINLIEKLCKHKKVMAIGEIGLDYYKNYCEKSIQKKTFEEQVKLAVKLNMPIVIHDREAHEDCYNILIKHKPLKVVFHCFSGDILFAEKLIKQGWLISFTGTITYKNSTLTDVVRLVPNDKFLIETDCPYLSPVPFRGKRNDPTNLRYTIEKIAEIKRESPKKIAEYSFNNGKSFFNIK